MTKEFQDLSGGMGRKIYFRADRYKAKELLERVRPVLFVNSNPYDIHDLSMNGVSFYTNGSDKNHKTGQIVSIILRLDEMLAYDGEGRIVRSEETSRGRKVAVQITEGFLDIPKLVSTHDELALKKESSCGVSHLADLVPAEYKEICSDVVFLFRRYRKLLRQYENLLQSANGNTPVINTHLHQCIGSFFSEWETLRKKANEVLLPILGDPAMVKATKRYTEEVVTPEFMDAPDWHRCYTKPLGYPGDYEMMNYFYRGEQEGDSLFAKYVHQIGINQPVANSVVERMKMLRDTIHAVVSSGKNGDEPIRITNLGCGPAREVQEYLQKNEPKSNVHFTLIDQDEGALSYAYGKLYPLLAKSQGKVTADCMYVSFAQLLKNPALLKTSNAEDLIYVSGLMDYLPTPVGQMVVYSLYERLAPGGLLVVGNMKAPNMAFWSPEFILDWTLIYRTKEDMLELADILVDAETSIRKDPTDIVYLLDVRKPLES